MTEFDNGREKKASDSICKGNLRKVIIYLALLNFCEGQGNVFILVGKLNYFS